MNPRNIVNALNPNLPRNVEDLVGFNLPHHTKQKTVVTTSYRVLPKVYSNQYYIVKSTERAVKTEPHCKYSTSMSRYFVYKIEGSTSVLQPASENCDRHVRLSHAKEWIQEATAK
jgi:hypothetical protein